MEHVYQNIVIVFVNEDYYTRETLFKSDSDVKVERLNELSNKIPGNFFYITYLREARIEF